MKCLRKQTTKFSISPSTEPEVTWVNHLHKKKKEMSKDYCHIPFQTGYKSNKELRN